MGMIFNIYGCTKAHIDFLALRYLEDIGFSCYVRHEVILEELPQMTGLDAQHIDGPHGKVAEIVRKRLQKFADDNLSGKHQKVIINSCYMPWGRMFEVGMEVHVQEM